MMYIIAGHAKTGTSMVANILHHLGVDMGKDFGDWFHHKENLPWIDAINGPRAVEFMRQMSARPRWGAKHPSFAQRVNLIIEDAIDATVDFRIIIPFRDCWATRASLHKEREDEITHARRLQMLVTAAERQLILAETLRLLSPIHHPKIFCFSYEKALTAPRPFFYNLMAFCELACTTDQAETACRYIRPGQGYLAIESWAEQQATPIATDQPEDN